MVFLFVLITSEAILEVFGGFEKVQKSKMADQGGHHSLIMTQLLRHVMSLPHNGDLKGETFRRTICPPSLVVIAFLFLELQGVEGGVGGRGGGGRESPTWSGLDG